MEVMKWGFENNKIVLHLNKIQHLKEDKSNYNVFNVQKNLMSYYSSLCM